eukprot:12674193-Heterocapsa_arctica.AAC.2
MPTTSRNYTGEQTSASPKHQEAWWLHVQVPFHEALPSSQGTVHKCSLYSGTLKISNPEECVRCRGTLPMPFGGTLIDYTQTNRISSQPAPGVNGTAPNGTQIPWDQ